MNRNTFLALAIVLPLGLAVVAGVVAVARHSSPAEPESVVLPPSTPTTRPGPLPPVSAPASGAPSPSKEGEQWNHRELFDYLKTRGVDCYYRGTGGLEVICRENADEEDRQFIDAAAQDRDLRRTRYLVSVQKCRTAETAKDAAGTTRHGFSWGRFLFNGSEDQLARFKTVLGVQ